MVDCRMARRPLVRQFSWSVSRDRLFRSCLRAYYYYYYGAWGGWEPLAPPGVRDLYVLKHLSTRQQWAGSAVHEVLEAVLRRLREGRPMRQAEAESRLTNLMRFRWQQSRAGSYRDTPKRGGLVEHEYALAVSADTWKSLHERSRRALAAAFTLGIFERLAAIPKDAWLGVERLDAFAVNGVPVYAVPDLAFRERERVVVIDWKTAAEEPALGADARFQLACYGLYARDRYGAAPEHVRLGVAFLGGPSYRELEMTAADLDAAGRRLSASALAMRSRLADRGTDVARETDFPPTDDTARCGTCAFRRPCRGASWVTPAA
jgi:hypothetical protein